MCIYFDEKVFIWCQNICVYSYGAFLWLKLLKWGFCLVLMCAYLFLWCLFIVKNYQKWVFYLVLNV